MGLNDTTEELIKLRVFCADLINLRKELLSETAPNYEQNLQKLFNKIDHIKDYYLEII